MDLNGDRMFCHACGGVWLRRSETGMICPRCDSDFTEIIEIPPDTEPEPPRRPTPPSPRRRRTRSPPNPFSNHNPWEFDEPPEEDNSDSYDFGSNFGPNPGHGPGPGFSHRAYRSPDGRFTFTSTTFGGSSGGGGGFSGGGFSAPPRSPGMDEYGDPLMPMVRRLDTIFQGLADTYREQGRETRLGETARQHDDFPDPEEHAPDEPYEPHEFGPTGRLFPRDAGGPQPMAAPLGTLGDILEMFRQDFGQGGPPGGPGGGSGARVMTGPNPLAMLSTLLNMDRRGDAVYSQEELDRVISQLVEQNANGTAPPPASQNSIQSLPKKKIDQEMLDSEGKAECSICMDPVDLGAEVTVLPCKHWFHYNCIEMWLIQHNTCPHCRRSIDASAQQGTRENPVTVNDSPEPASRRSSNAVPGQSGQSSWSWSHSSNNHQEQRRSSRGEGHGGGSFAGWVRSHFGGGN